MKPHVSSITLGVKNVNRAKQFYSTGPRGGEWVSLFDTRAVIASNPKARVPLCLKMLDDDVAVVVYTVTNYLQNVDKSLTES